MRKKNILQKKVTFLVLTAVILFGTCSLGTDIEQLKDGFEFESLPFESLSVEIDMVFVPGGSFQLGRNLGTSSGSDETPVSTVTISGFYMGKYQVTQEQYRAVMENNPSWFTLANGCLPAYGEVQRRRPVDSVNWYNAIVFCNRLSLMEGLTPVYSISGSTNPDDWGPVPASSNAIWNAVQIVLGSTGYRLPTEAQWEYAAKGGNRSPGSYSYSGSNNADKVAWYWENSGDRTHEVGKKAPNDLGIYDMSGNVWEWCWDWYEIYTNTAKTDPTGPASGSNRVLRGGSFGSWVEDTRSVYRGYYNKSYDPSIGYSNFGFRVTRLDVTLTGTLTGTVSIFGTAQVGQTLTADTKNLGGSGEIFYQWKRDENLIPDAANNTYTVQAPDVGSIISVIVTRANNTGSVMSDPTGIVTKFEIDMVFVPGGSFELGKELGTGGSSDVTPVSTVTMSGFYISKYQVTQEQYAGVMGSYPSLFNSNPVAGEVQGRRPVENVNWYSAIVFCNRLSMMDGLTPAYSISGSTNPDDWGTVPTSSNAAWNAVKVVPDSTGYRLPTEAQWEYAAKGGNESLGSYTYSGSNNATEVAWHSGNSGNRTHEVGKKAPNSLGIYDMSGNVWEWCWDWYWSYTNTAKTDPIGVVSGDFRVLRGGSWFSSAGGAQSVYRFYFNPDYRYSDVGFRVARPAEILTGTVNISGAAQVGQTLAADTKNLGGSGEISYQWKRGGDVIPDATNSTYSVQDVDVDSIISVVVTRANNSGSITSDPNPTAVLFTPEIVPGFEMVFVPGGTFELGRNLGTGGGSDETPVSTITMSSFYMGKYQITQEQYQAVIGSNPSWFTPANGREPAAEEVQGRRPVEQVSWYDAIVFCNRLSMMEGLTPAYSISGSTNPDEWGAVPYYDYDTGTIVGDITTWDVVQVVVGSNGYRLPTEAQWEYAAKGGNGSPGSYTYSGSNNADDVAWHIYNSGSRTHEVGKKAPNGLDIYDMSGNVWEWCWDWWDSYTNTAKTDPTGPVSGVNRVLRGGWWYVLAEGIRSAYRNYYFPYFRGDVIGFRVVRPNN